MSSPAPKQVPPRPFLKWAGGKHRLIRQYKDYFPEFKNYYEPFLGGGAVFFHLRPQSAVLTDINPDLINAYCCVRDKVESVILLLQEHQQQHGNEYYYSMRSLTPDTEIERAARFIYLNRTCFNGLYRENSQGEFNVPIGKYKNPQICNPELLRSVSATLKNVKIEEKSFEHVLESANSSDDFVYFDPPYYPVSSTSYFTAYSRHSFIEDDQKKLSKIFAELAGRGVKVMMSNSDCSFIRNLYSQFNIYEISAARAINSKIKKRGSIAEVLVTSY
ncbi:MAG: DNA adenine methylase [Hormoscilla sp. GM7CHS1pb]|nr:DNA adenine methylase [Hormoscilla sp. GM7CHS1pb]